MDLENLYRFAIYVFFVHFLCSPKENEPKERAPCHSVLRTFLCFSKGLELEETRFAQTVHELNPDLSAMLDLVAGLLLAGPNFWVGSREAI